MTPPDQMLASPDEAFERHAAYYLELLGRADALSLDGGEFITQGLQLLDSEWANIETAQSWAELNGSRGTTANSLCSQFADAGVYVLELRLHPRDRIRWLKNSLKAARRAKAPRLEVSYLATLGAVYVSIGRLRLAPRVYRRGGRHSPQNPQPHGHGTREVSI